MGVLGPDERARRILHGGAPLVQDELTGRSCISCMIAVASGGVPFDLRLLASFLAVADERHFGRAAARLDLAQPALSQQIRRLETQLGVALFARDARRVDLTGAGEAFLPGAREAVQAAQRAELAAQRAASGGPTTLRVAADLDLPGRIIARLRAFAQMRPDVELRIVRQHQGDALAALHSDQVDVVVGWGRIPYGPPVRSLTVDAEEIVAVLRDDHPDAHRRTIPRELFGRRQFVMFQREPSSDVFDWLAAAAGARQPEQLQIQQVQSLEDGAGAMLRAAARGCGQTLVGRTGFDPDAHPRLGTRSFDPPLLHDIVLMWTAESERDVIHDLGASFAW
jgi:DNA-binding transcriptional LysR family regulator